MPLSRFHPLIAEWFRRRFGAPTDVQRQSWPAIMSGDDTLIAAPTGSGKTLAAFLSCLDALFKQALAGELPERTQALYVSPLKALGNDVQKNLQQPLEEISALACAAGLLTPAIRVEVRSGDTPAGHRQRMLTRPPHLLITTPESLFLLLTAEKSRALLGDVQTVIVDEIHAVAPTKRGAHLALSLQRLEALTRTRPVRIGLSATQQPIEEIARFLVGQRPGREDAPLPCRLIDLGHRRPMDLAVEVPKDELGAVATNALWSDLYDRLAELVRAHRTTLVFVNTRRLAERVAHHLAERLGEDKVVTHHGSLSRKLRLAAEEQLKQGRVPVVVATASLELGIDIGTIDLVCQIGSPRALATALQRVGRSGHWVGAKPKGRLLPTTRDELIECAAVVRAIRAGILDRLTIPLQPLDILAQHVIAAAAAQDWEEEALYRLCTAAYPYRGLSREAFQAIVRMLSEGFSTARGRRGATLHYDRVNGRLRARRGARLAALTSGGAIPDSATYAVIAEPAGLLVGTVDEDFAVESLAGDIILLGNASWRIRGVGNGQVRVEDAQGAPPTIPFWRGEAPSRTAELSAEVAALRAAVAEAGAGAVSRLQIDCGLDLRGAEQAVAYLLAGRASLGAMPTQQTIIAERFFDESGGMQLVLHAPFGGRINRAWGLALRKRFCTTFDQELQAAATDEGLVISLGERHSFPLDAVFAFLHSATVREVLVQAVLASPMFLTRWRWNVTRALVLLRFSQGRRVPPPVQRMRAEELLASVFPDATACQENHHGPLPVPDHPLVQDALRDCLTEALDTDGLVALLQRIERGEIRCLAVETPEPSPLSHEILNANPYAFLDDAPLEERRARAVQMRRSLPLEITERLGALDATAIARVVEEAWPVVRDPDELHDALLSLIWVPAEQAPQWRDYLPALTDAGRAAVVRVEERVTGWVATERLAHARAVFPEALLPPALPGPGEAPEALAREDALTAIVQGWLESMGPVSAAELADKLTLPVTDVQTALLRLEAQGQVLRGRFREPPMDEWCDRRLLARIHRLTTAALRQAIEPVPAADFLRFLLRWQHCAPGTQLHGEAGLLEVLRQLTGCEAAGLAWERHILPARVAQYRPELLDRLCLSGQVAWGRLTPPAANRGAVERDAPAGRPLTPSTLAPISLFPREEGGWLFEARARRFPQNGEAPGVSAVAEDLLRYLSQRGASFFIDLVRGTTHLPAEVEDGLWELVAAGLVTADGFDSLRALLNPQRRRAEGKERGRRPRHSAGRWALFTPDALQREAPGTPSPPVIEQSARQLLRRYGIVFRDLLRREPLAPPWWELVRHYRRLELQGELRGGRFVAGFTGEQFALPEAVEILRAVRRDRQTAAHAITLSGADPLNLVGILTPGPRVPAVPTHSVTFRDGCPVEAVPALPCR